MKTNGNLDDMGTHMYLNQMDMNVVMCTEATRQINKKINPIIQGMKMAEDDYNCNKLSDILTLNYTIRKSPDKTNLPKEAPLKELKITLTGNMDRYLWSLDNKVGSEAYKNPN